MCRLLKESTKKVKGAFFDERSIEILILGRHALAKNRDIIGTIYQTCWDRLLCLETLDVTKDGWRKSFRKKWKEHVSIEQPKILEEEKKEEKREEERKKKIEKTEKEVIQQEAEKARRDRALVERKGKLEANLKQLRDELPSPKMKAGGWGNKQIPVRKDIKIVLDWLKAARTEDKLQICESQYPDVKSKWQDFMYKYRAWGKKEEEEKRQREQASQALKVRKENLAEPFQDLRKRFNRFRLKEEKPIVEKAKELADTIIKEIQGAEDLEQLKEMERYPTLEELPGLARETKNVKTPLSIYRNELEEKLGLLEERRTLIREMQNYKERLKKFDRDEEKDEVRDKNQALEDLLSKIYQTESNGDLISLKSDLTIFKQKLDGLIVSLEQRRAQQKTREEDQKQARKEQIQIQKQINKLQEEGKQKEREVNKKLQVIQNKKKEILEKSQKDLFDSRYLSSQEKAELDILLKYYKRKKAPVDGIISFLKDLGLIKWVNLYNETKKEPLNRWGYLGIDNKEYSELYFYDNWDRALPLIQVRIDQIKQIAIQNRKNKLELAKEWDRLDKQEQSLKIPLYYIRINRRLVRARYLGEKKDQRLHFELEDGTPWMLIKVGGWTVQTKIEYGGELFPYITEKGSIIVVRTNEGEREISKDQIFCYIYDYKGPKPVK
ncbi:hypothetical protein ES702_03891 [subsurface metagenome]